MSDLRAPRPGRALSESGEPMSGLRGGGGPYQTWEGPYQSREGHVVPEGPYSGPYVPEGPYSGPWEGPNKHNEGPFQTM